MDSTTYDSMLNNIIAYYGLLIAILLPVIVLLIGNMRNSPEIDKQILFRKIFPIKYFGILLGAFILPELQFLLFYSYFLENTIARIIVILITIVTTSSIFFLITKIMAWISSGEDKDAFHGFYRQNLRSDFLAEGTVKEKSDKWYQFWSDEKNIGYFGNDIYRYIDDYFGFLNDLKGEEWEYAKRSCAAFYFDIADFYKIGKKELRINAHNDETLARQLIKTVPFCICANLMQSIGDISEKDGGITLQCGIFISALLEEMEKDDNLDNSEWIVAFNLFFFGTKKKKDKALAIIAMIMSHYNQNKEVKRTIKQKINKLLYASSEKYRKYYQQLYKEMSSFNPDSSILLKMIIEGAQEKEE